MTKDEALDLALEALEAGEYYIDDLEAIVYASDDLGIHEDRAKMQAAITAIKQAIAAPVYVKTFHGGKPWPLHPAPEEKYVYGTPLLDAMTKDYEPVDGAQVSKVWWDDEKLMAKPIPFVEFYKPVQEPVAWKWHQAPVKTSWGHDMVVADLAIDKDNTVSVYCERDQTAKVEAMFSTPPSGEKK